MMNHLRQIIYEMKTQPMVTWITIIGTALAIFLLMSSYSLNNIHNVESAPESRRSRILYGVHMVSEATDGSMSCAGNLSLESAKTIYENLEGIECLSIYTSQGNTQAIVGNNQPVTLKTKSTDHNYWNIYDYTFTSGHPYDAESVKSNSKSAVITESASRRLFGRNENAVGRTFKINGFEFYVEGVIKDTNPIMTGSFSDIFIPLAALGPVDEASYGYCGPIETVMLMKPGVKEEDICRQVERRYKTFQEAITKKGDTWKITYNGQPYNTERESISASNTNPDPELAEMHRMQYIFYAILLLLPAMNLSSLTRSRLNKRVAEIGVRRAFGCTRKRIISELLTENLIVTTIGGAIGIILSIIALTMLSNYFLYFGQVWDVSMESISQRPSFSMLFDWKVFGIAILLCLIINILSAGIPAWKASRTNPAEAIRAHIPTLK